MLVIGVFTLVLLRNEKKRLEFEARERLVLMSGVVKNGFISMMIEGRGVDFQDYIDTMAAEDVYAVRLIRKNGEILGSSAEYERGALYPEWDALRLMTLPAVTVAERDGHLIYSMWAPLENEVRCKGCHPVEGPVLSVLNVDVMMDGLRQSIADSREQTVITYLIMLVVLAGLLAVMTDFLVTKPLADMARGARGVREDPEAFIRFPEGRKDEIGELGRSLNSMLSELSRAREAIATCRLESLERLEKLATLGELSAAIAHEIKNPLAGISGAIQVVAEDYAETDPRKGIIRDVLAEIERLDRAIRDLLLYASPPEPHPVRVDVNALLEKAVRLVSVHANETGVSVDFAPGPDGLSIPVDPDQIQQVFLNIMLNSVQSMPDGGSIAVATGLIAGGKTAEITITDTGTALSDEAIQRFFKPFFSTGAVGTGFGLAISKNIVEKHGGRLGVESGRERGRVFRVILPMEAAKGNA